MTSGALSAPAREEALMVHACACCSLRFTTTAELADHVNNEHRSQEPFTEGRLSVQAYRKHPVNTPLDDILAPRR